MKDTLPLSLLLLIFIPSFFTVMLGQVMHRLKLTWTADAGGTTSQTSSTFRILFWIGIITWILINFVPYLPRFFLDEYGQPTDAYYNVNFLCQAVVLVYAIYKTVLICKTRKYIREQYGIPEQQCHGCEDCCHGGLWCLCWCLLQWNWAASPCTFHCLGQLSTVDV